MARNSKVMYRGHLTTERARRPYQASLVTDVSRRGDKDSLLSGFFIRSTIYWLKQAVHANSPASDDWKTSKHIVLVIASVMSLIDGHLSIPAFSSEQKRVQCNLHDQSSATTWLTVALFVALIPGHTQASKPRASRWIAGCPREGMFDAIPRSNDKQPHRSKPLLYKVLTDRAH